MALAIRAECCKEKGAPAAFHLEPRETVYIQVGSPATYHASALRYECPTCGKVVLEVERSIIAEPTRSLWGEPDE